MHYANGRIAKNGDKVVLMNNYGSPVLGILYDAQAGNNDCNGRIAVCTARDVMPDLKSCLHYDDVAHLFAQKAIPDSSSATVQPGNPADYDPEAATTLIAKFKDELQEAKAELKDRKEQLADCESMITALNLGLKAANALLEDCRKNHVRRPNPPTKGDPETKP